MTEGSVAHLRPTKPCPICGKPSVRAFHPFCSNRCADIDLNRWLSGSYVIPAQPEETEQEQPADPGSNYEEDEF